jgi:hypothetical protein
MGSSTSFHRLLLLPGLCLAAAAGAAPPAGGKLRAPEVNAEGYRLVIEQVQQQQYEQTDFPPGGQPGGTGKPSGRQVLNLKLAVFPPAPEMLTNIDGLDQKIVASAGADKPITLRSWPADDGAPVAGGPWRSMLMAQDVELSARSLKKLQGELIVFPKARNVTLEFPANAKPGTTKGVDGFKVTLNSVKTRGNTLTVVMQMEWPDTLSVTRPNPELPSGISAVTKAGLALMPSGGSTSNGDMPGRAVRLHNLSFVDVKEPPDRIRVEALIRSGGARHIRFTFPEIPLPSGMALEGDPSEAEEPGPLEPSDPFFAKGGGTLVVPIHTRSPGRLMIGLSRLENGAAGPWRWLLPSQDRADRATLSSVKPGRYRVVRAWLPPSETPDLEPLATPVRLGEMVEVQVEPGAAQTLPAIEGQGKR